MRRAGLQPKLTIVRGGTDGSRFTELGLPTPNLSTGEHNPHSPLEWTCLEEMATAVRVLVELAKVWGAGASLRRWRLSNHDPQSRERQNRGVPEMKPTRRSVLQAGLFGCVAAAAEALPADDDTKVATFDLDEITIDDLQERMKSGKLTARAITERYLARIDAVDKKGPAVNSVIEVNPDALKIADALDEERKTKGARGPLHGIPMLIKDNIDTADKMATTAGSLALVGAKPPKDAFLVERLRKAGVILLGKTNLSEWANIRSNSSSSGWSGRGGQTHNPYVLDRNPSGSSSGSAAAVAANFCAVAVGTETNGSIVSPSTRCGIVGLKPTVGLVSRSGIIPIAHSHDTAGPMGRTVRDVAILLRRPRRRR